MTASKTFFLILEGSDLDNMSQSLYFTEAGRQCINVTISSDMLVESLEQVVAVLRSEDSAVKLGQSSALIAIMDSDSKKLALI